MFIPERTARTIRLDVVLTNGTFTLAAGTDLPKIKRGALAELVIHASDLLDDKERKTLVSEHEVLFLPKGTLLWARVNDDPLPEELRKHRVQKQFYTGGSNWGVAFALGEELKLRIRATKASSLTDCKCHIPSLDREAESVNEAYTHISTAFEPKRRAHTGNVFNCVFIELEVGMRPLDHLRLAKEISQG